MEKNVEGRRTTRGRPSKRVEEVAPITTTNKRNAAAAAATTAPTPATTLRASPSRTRTSSPGRTRGSPARIRQISPPVRRSSRPRSSASSATITIAPVVPPSPIKETKEPKASPKPRIGRVFNKSPVIAPTTKSTVQSSSYSSTKTTFKIRTTDGEAVAEDTELFKLSEFIRRSLSKGLTSANGRDGSHTPTTNTEAESRYSRSVSRSIYDDDNVSKAEFSESEYGKPSVIMEDDEEDQEDDEQYKSFNASHPTLLSHSSTTLLCRKLEVPREFGGVYGALALMLVAPWLAYYLQWCCGELPCVFKTPNLLAFFNVDFISQQLFPPQAVVAFLIFNTGVFVLSESIYGKCVRLAAADRNSLGYKFTALPMAVLLTLAVGVAEYLQYPLADFVLQHYLRFCLYSILNAYIVAQWCYIRADMLPQLQGNNSTQPNVYGKTGNCVIDYAQGRQLNPKWLGFVEFKSVFYRTALLSTLLYAECFIYKSLQLPALSVAAAPANGTLSGADDVHGLWQMLQLYSAGVKYDAAALLTASMLLLYVVDAVAFEHHLASSFELQGEGFGCLLLLRYAVTPYLLSAVAKYFQQRQVPVHCQFAIYLPLLLLFTGLVVKRFSNALKYKYRLNPSNPIFYGMETIHTFQGRRLLLGGLWGRVRQPNYAGDILALIALALPLYLRFAWPPLASLLCCVAVLLHRARRVNSRNLARYHSSWVRYCSQVRSYVLPKVY